MDPREFQNGPSRCTSNLAFLARSSPWFVLLSCGVAYMLFGRFSRPSMVSADSIHQPYLPHFLQKGRIPLAFSEQAPTHIAHAELISTGKSFERP
jgi:hypothetical protein